MVVLRGGHEAGTKRLASPDSSHSFHTVKMALCGELQGIGTATIPPAPKARVQTPCWLLGLPRELIAVVMWQLRDEVGPLLVCRQVCKRLGAIVTGHDSLWRWVCAAEHLLLADAVPGGGGGGHWFGYFSRRRHLMQQWRTKQCTLQRAPANVPLRAKLALPSVLASGLAGEHEVAVRVYTGRMDGRVRELVLSAAGEPSEATATGTGTGTGSARAQQQQQQPGEGEAEGEATDADAGGEPEPDSGAATRTLGASSGGDADANAEAEDQPDGSCAVVSMALGAAMLWTGSMDSAVTVWDCSSSSDTFEAMARLEFHKGGVISLVTNDRYAMSGSLDGTVAVWRANAQTLADRQTQPEPEPWQRPAACAGWLHCAFEQHEAMIASLAISPVSSACGGRLGCSGSNDQTVYLYDLEAGKALSVFTGHTDCIGALAVWGDAAILSGSDDCTIRVWPLPGLDALPPRPCDAASASRRDAPVRGHARLQLQAGEEAPGDTVSTGKRTADSRGREDTDAAMETGIEARRAVVARARVKKQQARTILTGHADWVLRLRVVPSRNTLVSSSSDCTIRIWDLERMACLHVLARHEGLPTGLEITCGGRFIISASEAAADESEVNVWDLQEGALMCVITLQAFRVFKMTPEIVV